MVYTCYTYEYFLNKSEDIEVQNRKDICKEIIKCCDFMVDGPYMEDLRDLSLPFRGSSNQRIIDLSLEKNSS